MSKLTPQEDLQLSILALSVYGVEPSIINNMLENLRKICEKKVDAEQSLKALFDLYKEV